ncbi:MAG: isocitrate/isopropylmalate dehydrogenase family protein, partial [Elusimicrobiota bacterium]|nr:isocitrate/isopropylmalate dehydrogenase family protein [Elusimicrobiota bacterium]
MAYKVTLIPGDGTGPEIVEIVVKVVEATGVKIDWEIANAGVDIMEKEGTPLPQKTIDLIAKNKIALKGPVTTPIGSGFRSVNVAIRKELDLYACIRPCKIYEGVKSKYENINLVVVRENTEDLYAGVEFDKDSPQAKEIIKMADGKIREDSAISIKPISAFCSERIVRFAFEY